LIPFATSTELNEAGFITITSFYNLEFRIKFNGIWLLLFEGVALNHIIQKMHVLCKSCGNEFNDLVKEVRYSSSIKEFYCFVQLVGCCKNSFNKPAKEAIHLLFWGRFVVTMREDIGICP
jgi:hypothetical protein